MRKRRHIRRYAVPLVIAALVGGIGAGAWYIFRILSHITAQLVSLDTAISSLSDRQDQISSAVEHLRLHVSEVEDRVDRLHQEEVQQMNRVSREILGTLSRRTETQLVTLSRLSLKVEALEQALRNLQQIRQEPEVVERAELLRKKEEGITRYEEGGYTEALELLEDVVEVFPDDEELLFYYTAARLKTQWHDSESRALLVPEVRRYLSFPEERVQEEAYDVVITAAFAEGSWKEVLSLIEQARVRGVFRREWGRYACEAAYHLRRWEDVLRWSEEAVGEEEMSAGDPDLLLMKGEALQELGRRGEAIEVYHFLLSTSPRHYGARIRLARLHLLEGAYEKAEEVIAPLKPSYEVLLLRGDCAAGLGDREEAEAFWREALTEASSPEERQAVYQRLEREGRTLP